MKIKEKLSQVVSQGNYLFDESCHCEHPVGTSMTVPDEAYSISEILEKFTHGLAPAIQKEPLGEDPDLLGFDDDDPFKAPDFDISDVGVIAQEVADLQAKADITASIKEPQPKEATKEATDRPGDNGEA